MMKNTVIKLPFPLYEQILKAPKTKPIREILVEDDQTPNSWYVCIHWKEANIIFMADIFK